MTQPADVPWGIYVHVPWCRRRCVYCDFVFDVDSADERFVDVVLAELQQRSDEWGRGAPQTLYLGGGTPTHLPAPALHQLVEGVRNIVDTPDLHVAIEANPEDLAGGAAEAMRDVLTGLGTHRVSLGVQSFDDDVLKWLGRKHRRAQAIDAVSWAVAHVPQVSCDLIIGVPHGPASRVTDDLQALLDLQVGHVSSYMLTVEPDTALDKLVALGRKPDVDDDHQADDYDEVRRTLHQAGYAQYEVSSFARPGQHSAHNRLYWGQGMWVGLGPGAHSLFITDDGRHIRRAHGGSIAAYLASPTPVVDDELSAADAFVEAVAFGLRDVERGVLLDDLAHRHAADALATVREQLQREAQLGNVLIDGDHVVLTPQGIPFADGVARRVLQVQ